MSKTPVILYRPIDFSDNTEELSASTYFPILRQRTDIKPNDLVIGRYSVLPYYDELEKDILNQEAELINSYRQHQFIADIMEWAPILGRKLTPKTWERMVDLPENCSFVVKGQTNSRKDRWNTHMFAKTKRDAVDVTLRLQEDSLINQQKIYYREYLPLKTYMIGLNGKPITEEFRFFLLNGKILTSGYYWTTHVDELPSTPKIEKDMEDCVLSAVDKLKDCDCLPPFLVIDVARKENGEPVVIELNDGQMSGLSEVNPDTLYRRLKEELTNQY